VDYQAMSGSELQAECARRGLPSSRAAKAVMVQRLLDHDAQSTTADSADTPPAGGVIEGAQPADTDTVPAPLSGPESVLPTRVFQQTFPAELGGPDEETHLAYRQATLVAAADAGHQTRGDARLTAVRDGEWVYEVSVRAVT